jgi:hypothetical protein
MENCFGESGARSEESMGYSGYAAIETTPEESSFGIVVGGCE